MSFEKYFKQWDVDLYEQTETGTEDIELIRKLIGGSGGLRMFEVACGSGRILLPLVRDGHRMTGMDIDNRMLARLFEKADGLSDFAIFKDDAVEADWGNGYDVAILGGNILLNIESEKLRFEAQRIFVQKAFNVLQPGGYLFMDNNGFLHPERFFFNHPGERVIFDGTDRAGVYGRYMLVDSIWDAVAQSVSGTRRWELKTPEGETFTKEETYLKAIPLICDMEAWMVQAGFEIEQRFGDYGGNPINGETYRAIYWARKPLKGE